jgi:hypothetical protein
MSLITRINEQCLYRIARPGIEIVSKANMLQSYHNP